MDHYQIYIISDSIGDTAENVANAALRQFPDLEFQLNRYTRVEDDKNLAEILNEANGKERPIIFHSFAKRELSEQVRNFCLANDLKDVDVLTAGVDAIARSTRHAPVPVSGALRRLDASYFSRIESIEFAVRYDDGKDPRGLKLADVGIIGVSRTSKTPLCMYLANKSIKATNIPLVPELPVPRELFEVPNTKIIGLTNSPEKLIEIRKERMRSMGLSPTSSYTNYARVFEEIEYASEIMHKIGCPVFDVTNRAIEETADLVIRHLRKMHII